MSLPPDHKTAESTAAWLLEIEGLRTDLQVLASRPQGLRRIAVLGDWNMQPASLEDVQSRPCPRVAAFTKLLQDFDLVL